MKNRYAAVAVAGALAAILSAGCAGTRAGQFRTFAEAGRSYAQGVVTLTEEAGAAAIDADSEVLMQMRDALEPAARSERYREHTRALRDLLDELRALREHTLLLERYFTALARLAASDAPEKIAGGAADVAARLVELSPRLAAARLGAAPVGELVGPATALAVGGARNRALERELRARAAVIERELELQRVFLEALAEHLESDLRAILDARGMRELARPYVGTRNLPSRWKRDRREVLSARVTLASAENAAEAARELKETFAALVENRLAPGDFDALFADLDAMLDLIELVAGGTEDDD